VANWRLAKSLIVLTSEIEYLFPDTTVWDIGDKAHQNSWSDHNPNECCDVVCAVDILPDAGLDLAKFVKHIVANPHPNLRYVIFDELIYQRKNGFKPQAYHGVNKHKKHAHASVGNGPDGRSTGNYDSTATWDIDDLGKKPSKPPTPSKPSKPSTGTKLGDKMPTIQNGNKGSRVRILQGLLLAWHYNIKLDGIFGDKTEAAVRDFQRKHAKPVDGLVGTLTWNKLLDI
jgi:hypothetical protein